MKVKEDGYNFVHNNLEIWETLNFLQPKIVITTGMNPTHLYAFVWAKLNGVHHIYMTDGTESSERNLSWKHRFLRRWVLRGSSAGIAASISGQRLLQLYGLPRERIHLSRLCADNNRFKPLPFEDRKYDVMFCGQLHERKLPYFFASVCAELRYLRGYCHALVIGNGPERDKMLDTLRSYQVDATYLGFVQPEFLPNFYAQAKLLLFTTRLDPWGVVANEAMASGTPVITTPEAGVSGDLVLDQKTGRVLAPDLKSWTNACLNLLDDRILWKAMSFQALEHVKSFNYKSAADGLVTCCNEVLQSSADSFS
jgi:glycosyltransferase involved in cell wall biosynthesis